MQPVIPAWYAARTKSKHEHIAAANLRKQLGLEIFLPRIRLEKLTRRGLIKVIETLFPCYLFIRCVIEEQNSDIQHTAGISRMVHFGGIIPQISDSIIIELQAYFGEQETMTVESQFAPGDEVLVADGAFAGTSAKVLKSLPAKKRVQILLDILGRPTAVEVGRDSVVLKKNTLADLAPILAAPIRQERLRV